MQHIYTIWLTVCFIMSLIRAIIPLKDDNVSLLVQHWGPEISQQKLDGLSWNFYRHLWSLEDESFWSPDFSPRATISFTFLFMTEMSQQQLDGLPCNLVQTVMSTPGWIVKTLHLSQSPAVPKCSLAEPLQLENNLVSFLLFSIYKIQNIEAMLVEVSKTLHSCRNMTLKASFTWKNEKQTIRKCSVPLLLI